MSFIDTRKLLSRRGAKNKQPVAIPQQNWRGVNYVDDIYTMPAHQIPYGLNVDMGKPIGAITKCAGYEDLFSTLGTGGIKGLHAWEHSTGDKLIAAWSNYLYLLSGASGSISKTSQADWEAGTGVNTDMTTTAGDVVLAYTGADFSEADTLTADFNGTHDDTVAGSDKVTLATGTDTNAVALLHMNGASNGTTFTDECGHTVTVTGTVTTNTSVKKFGTASAKMEGGTDYLTLAASTDWHFGSDAFTVDGWVYSSSLPPAGEEQGIFYCGTGVNSEYGLFLEDGVLKFIARHKTTTPSYDNIISMSHAVSINTGAWHHFEISRSGNTWYMFWDGTAVATVTDDCVMPSPAAGFLIGYANNYDMADPNSWNGYIDEFRVSKGICRHTADFTPATVEHVITGYLSGGTYTHTVQDVSGIAVTTGLTIAYNKTEATDTTVTFQTRTSTNGGASYGAWTTRASGATLAASGTDISLYRIQWRAVLASTDPHNTPSLNDVTLAGNTGRYTSGSWISPVYDITNTPLTSVLSWVDTEPANTSVTWYASGSSNGVIFGDWQEITSSGGAIPLLRYVQVKFVMAGLVTATPTVSSLLLSYSTSYTQANRLDIQPLGRTGDKLTGNRVSMQDYEDRCYCADGLRPFVLYVDDDTVVTGTSDTRILNPFFATYTGTADDDMADTFTSWTALATGTGQIEAVTDGIKIKQTAAGAAGQVNGVYQDVAIADIGFVIGDTIAFQTSYKMSAQTSTVTVIHCQFLTAADAVISSMDPVSSETAVVATTTTKNSANKAIPATCTKLRIRAYIYATGAYGPAINTLTVHHVALKKTNTIKLAAAASAVDDFYNNSFITITAGNGNGDVRFISDYNGTTKEATVSANWSDPPVVYGTYSISSAVKVRKAGVDAPTVAPTLADSAVDGLPNGAYLGKYTFVNEDGYESNPSDASASCTVATNKITWTVPVDASAGNTTASRKLYRTKAGAAVYYYVATISDNTTTAYTDNIADASLTMLMLDNNNIPPATCSLVYEFLTYMFYVNGDELWFSKAGLPEAVPNITGDIQMNMCPSTILDIKSNPMALIPSGNNFIAPITTSSGFIFDSDPTVDTTTMKEIDRNGSLSAWASDICISPDLRSVLVFPTNTGVRVLLPGLQEESIESIPLSRNIQPYFNLTVNRTNMAGIFFNQYYYLSMEYDALATAANEYITFVYDFRTSEWYGPWEYGCSCYAVSGNKLYGGDCSNGIIRLMNTGSSFAGENINMIADLPMVAPAGENHTYKYNKFMMMLSGDSVTTSTTVKPKIDEREATVALGALTDSFAGDSRPGHNNIRTRKYRIPLARGSTLSYRITDDSTNPISIQKIITECTPLPLRK